ncbi:MAG: hypothetical protein CMJ77_11720 [Planctomycetaceae bacterium]|nr:hypothetical protein [Planctomycetaceae bacterium]
MSAPPADNKGTGFPRRFLANWGQGRGAGEACCGFALVEIWLAETYTIREGRSICWGRLADHRKSG